MFETLSCVGAVIVLFACCCLLFLDGVMETIAALFCVAAVLAFFWRVATEVSAWLAG